MDGWYRRLIADFATISTFLTVVVDVVESLVAYFPQNLNKAKSNYIVTKLECLNAVTRMKKFPAYAEGMQSKFENKHVSLLWLMR